MRCELKARVNNGEGITLKALLIEDNRQVVRDITFCLQVRYPEAVVVSVDKGLRGVEMAETESPDLVMVDSSLPDIDTLDLVSKIREFSDVPLLILSGSESDMDRAKGLEAGADEYVAKPFSPIELLARVKALLRRHQRYDPPGGNPGLEIESRLSKGDDGSNGLTPHRIPPGFLLLLTGYIPQRTIDTFYVRPANGAVDNLHQ
jgi:DNA-binding response OmpR family regulator